MKPWAALEVASLLARAFQSARQAGVSWSPVESSSRLGCLRAQAGVHPRGRWAAACGTTFVVRMIRHEDDVMRTIAIRCHWTLSPIAGGHPGHRPSCRRQPGGTYRPSCRRQPGALRREAFHGAGAQGTRRDSAARAAGWAASDAVPRDLPTTTGKSLGFLIKPRAQRGAGGPIGRPPAGVGKGG
jgi:hypothetical protein